LPYGSSRGVVTSKSLPASLFQREEKSIPLFLRDTGKFPSPSTGEGQGGGV
jgi:hypothetical protein